MRALRLLPVVAVLLLSPHTRADVGQSPPPDAPSTAQVLAPFLLPAPGQPADPDAARREQEWRAWGASDIARQKAQLAAALEQARRQIEAARNQRRGSDAAPPPQEPPFNGIYPGWKITLIHTARRA